MTASRNRNYKQPLEGPLGLQAVDSMKEAG
jgi:hypothetical protein